MTAQPSLQAAMSDMCLTVQVGGEMDYQSAPFYRSRLLDEITWRSRGQRCVVLDLSSVPFCDSAGLNVLLWARRQAEQAGAVLVLACVPPSVRRILSMTGVDTVLRVYSTVTEAENDVVVGGGA